MVAPRAELVGNVVHVHLWVGEAAAAVRLWLGGAGRGEDARHERDHMGRAVVRGEEDGIEGDHAGVGVHGARRT